MSSPPTLMQELGLEVWHDDAGHTRGSTEITPAMFVPGTDRLRLGVLATIVDVCAGIPAHGPINPTIDLRVTLLAPPPVGGTIDATCRPVKVGQRLFLGEVLLHAHSEPRPFARGLATFMNRSVSIPPVFDSRRRWVPSSSIESFDEMIDLRSIGTADAPVFEVRSHDGIANQAGTVSGGAQALVTELAAEHVLPRDHEWVGVDLDLRFLNGVKAGPLVAIPERRAVLDGVLARVPLMEGGDRRIALALARFIPVDVFGTGDRQ